MKAITNSALEGALAELPPIAIDFALQAIYSALERDRVVGTGIEKKLRAKLRREHRQLRRELDALRRLKIPDSNEFRLLFVRFGDRVPLPTISPLYFKRRRRQDPGKYIEIAHRALSKVHHALKESCAALQNESTLIQPPTKAIKSVFWRNGALDYTLTRLLRENGGLRSGAAQERITVIRALIGKAVPQFEPDKGHSSTVETAVRRLSRADKLRCDALLDAQVGLPLPSANKSRKSKNRQR